MLDRSLSIDDVQKLDYRDHRIRIISNKMYCYVLMRTFSEYEVRVQRYVAKNIESEMTSMKEE